MPDDYHNDKFSLFTLTLLEIATKNIPKIEILNYYSSAELLEMETA